MSRPMNRRDFMKLMALLPPGAFFSRFLESPEHPLQDPAAQNVLVVVFDTFSAEHISFYGYPRETMPNLRRIVERGIVYHNHHASGNWTTPGTASLLTATYPWTHRAFSERDRIAAERIGRDLFSVFDGYHRLGYSHNTIVNRFLYQFYDELEMLKPQKELFTANNLTFDKLFPWDGDLAPLSWDRIMVEGEKGYTYSLFLAELYERYHQAAVKGLVKEFPRGIPHTGEDSYYTLEDGINWLTDQLGRIPRPFAGYFHYLPPHRPYNTRREFVDVFSDDALGHFNEKPRHPVFDRENLDKPVPLKYQKVQRQHYDEFILYVDAEFGRLYDSMQKLGLLENTWVVFTSDHGEMFERGVFGHKTPLLYEPVIRIPLIILPPGQTKRIDIHAPTGAVDVLPTLAKVTGRPVPDWTEGRVLPPFAEVEERPVFALEASDSKEDGPLNPASVMLLKGRYKLTCYFGYAQLEGAGPLFELYDLENDPQEMVNLYSESLPAARELRDELLAKVREVDKPYK